MDETAKRLLGAFVVTVLSYWITMSLLMVARYFLFGNIHTVTSGGFFLSLAVLIVYVLGKLETGRGQSVRFAAFGVIYAVLGAILSQVLFVFWPSLYITESSTDAGVKWALRTVLGGVMVFPAYWLVFAKFSFDRAS